MSEQTRDFLKALFGEDVRGYIELRARNPQVERFEQEFVRGVDDAVSWAEERAETHNVYVGVLPRKRKSGKADSIEEAEWAWLDVDSSKNDDKSTKELLDKVMTACVLPPTMIVNSGGGLHIYFRIRRTEDLKRLQEAMNQLADKVGADRLGDPPRILRVPGTSNLKYDEPRPVELMHLNIEQKYTLEDLEACAAVDSKTARRVHTGDLRGYTGDRSARDWATILELMDAGLSDAAIKTIWQYRRIGDKFREAGGKRYLEQTLKKARERVEEARKLGQSAAPKKRSRKSRKKPTDHHNIVAKEDGYYFVQGDGAERQMSTFIFDPEVLLAGDLSQGEQDVLIGTVKASGYSWPNVSFTRKAFTNVSSLARELPVMAWQFIGTDRDVRLLLPFLMELLRDKDLPKRSATPVLGLHKEVMVGPEQTLGKTGILEEDKAPIVWLPTKRVHPKIQFEWIDDDTLRETLDEFCTLFFGINEPGVVYPALGWAVATLLKPKLSAQDVMFPVLNIFGTRGSGKTSLMTKVLQPLLCYGDQLAWDYNTSRFVLLSLFGSSNTFPIAFSEYRSSGSDAGIERFIRLSYDLGFDARGRSDQTTVDYPLLAPFSVDGEDAIADPACMERMIQVNLHPETISEGSDAYNSFQLLQATNLRGLGTRLAAWMLSREVQFAEVLALARRVHTGPLPDRVRRNHTVVILGLQAFWDFAKEYGATLPVLDEAFLRAVLHPSLENVVNLETGRTRIIVDDLVEDIIEAVAHVDEQPYGLPFAYKYDSSLNQLHVHMAAATKWWYAKRARERQVILDAAAIKAQLKERAYVEGGHNVGAYVVRSGPKSVEGVTRHMHSFDLKLALEAGLDIPDKLTVFSVKRRSNNKEEARNGNKKETPTSGTTRKRSSGSRRRTTSTSASKGRSSDTERGDG